MGFKQKDNEGRGGFARIWSIDDKGNYSVAKLSTSKKREDGSYETDFQDGFVRLIGSAHKKAQTLNVSDKGVSIQITSCEVTTAYNAETKKGYTNYAIFAFDVPDGNAGASTSERTGKKSVAKAKASKDLSVDDETDDDLPF